MIEWTGVWGFDFIAVLAGSALYTGFRQRFQAWPQVTAAFLIIGAWGTVGAYQLSSWDQKIAHWPTKSIGIVQTNRPASIQKQNPEPGYSRVFPLEMDMSQQLAKQGAEVLFWPEGFFYGYAYWLDVRANFHGLIGTMGIPLLFLDSGFSVTPEGRQHYNTTFFITAEGREGGSYHKRHLVPFGEYTPFLAEWKWAKALLGDFLASLSAGQFDQTFDAAGMRIVPKICYEAIFPIDVAQSIGSDSKGKLVLVQSQDGWYGESSQPEQHLASTMLRAIENRVPLVHVLNNGPSAAINPNGRYAFKAPAFAKGQWIAHLPYSPSSGGSFYSRHPGWFQTAVQLFTAGLLVLGWMNKRKK